MFLVGSIQEAIADLLRVVEPRFLTSARDIWMAFSVILLIVAGVKAWAQDRTFEAVVYRVGETMMRVLIALVMIRFYTTQIPGVGYSFPQLISGPAFYYMNVLDVGAVEHMYAQVSEMWGRVMMPSIWAFLPMALYFVFMLEMLVVKMLVLYVIAWPLIAAAICQLLGPLFIPFILWKRMDWIFYGWLRAFIQYAFVPVVAMAFLMIADRFVSRFLTSLPPVVTVANFGVYLANAMVVMLFLAVGLFKIQGLTASLFSGYMHDGGGGGIVAAAVRSTPVRA